MKTFLIIWVTSIILAYIIHKAVGFYLISKLKKDGKYELYKDFDKYEKKNRPLTVTIQIKIILFIPVFNVLISIVEIIKNNETYDKLLDALKTHQIRLDKKNKNNSEKDEIINDVVTEN